MEGFNSESEAKVEDIISGMKVEVIDNKHVSLSIRRLRTHRAKLAPRVKPKKNSSTTTTKCGQQVISAIPCHTVFIFLNPQLLGALQVVYQGKDKSPFETHTLHMWTFLIAMCFYSVVLGFKIYMLQQARCNGHFASILNHVLLVSGSLSSLSLLSMFQPRLFVWFLCIIGAYMPLMLALHLLKNPLLQVISAIPCHTVIIFLNPQLLGALQVVYQGKDKSPFETHALHMWTFLIAACFYSVVLGFKIHMLQQARCSAHFASILNHVLLVSGSLSSVSLLSTFQPRLFVWFLCIIGVYMPLMLALHLLKNSLL